MKVARQEPAHGIEIPTLEIRPEETLRLSRSIHTVTVTVTVSNLNKRRNNAALVAILLLHFCRIAAWVPIRLSIARIVVVEPRKGTSVSTTAEDDGEDDEMSKRQY